jgi:WhiB family redox-sensing transcriptional regulator
MGKMNIPVKVQMSFDPTEGACANEDPNMFFPEAKNYKELVREAKSVCATCPFSKACLLFALQNEIDNGIWGGATPKERDHIRRHPTVIDDHIKTLVMTGGKRDIVALTVPKEEDPSDC